jgi:hypothetical protein
MSDYFDRLERQLVRATETRTHATQPRPRAVLGPLAGVAAVIVVVVIAATVGQPSGRSAPATGSAPRGIMLTRPVGSGPGLTSALDADVVTLRHRLRASFPNVNVTRVGQTIVLGNVPARRRTAVLRLIVPGRLRFLDWEANVLLPGGRIVASGLERQDRRALVISQGAGSAVPGSTGAGSLPLYQAVKLAAAQPPAPNANNARFGREYYLFGAPGSAACATAAKDRGYIVQAGQHCMLLAQPLDETTTNPTTIATDLASLLAPGVKASQGQQIVVPQGTVVLLAAPTTAGQHLNFYSPNAQFYVLKDNVALFGNDITNPQPSTDQTGNPDVTFGFNGPGQNKFQSVTATIAHRGDLVSGFGQTLDQHFAVALDNKLITVPSIDFKTYPDGITGGGGADITGDFTRQSAQELATLLQSAPLAVPLTSR